MPLRSFLALCCVYAVAATAPPPPAENRDVWIPMRDGVRLSANLYRPSSQGRFPTILVRTPYNKGGEILPGYRYFVEHGYAVVVQDVRGRYKSEGVFRPFTQEIADGDDTLSWIARQAWSNGNIGMVGGSYNGIVQWKAALSGNPHLKAIAPVVAGDDEYLDRFYSTGGALKLGHRLLWLSENLKQPGFQADFSRFVRVLPVRRADRAATGHDVDLYQQALQHPAYDSFWKALSTREQMSRVHVPALIVGGWYDNYVESDFDAFTRLRRTMPATRLIVGPWPHNMSIKFPGIDFGPDAMKPIRQMQRAWFDHWLKSVPLAATDPPILLFVMGANVWRDEQEWPLARARTRAYYLGSHQGANSLAGDGFLKEVLPTQSESDQYTYDPKSPVPTRGGAVCCNPAIFPWGPLDQRTIEARRDVLVYSTPPLSHDVEVTGNVRLSLFVSTSAADTDFTAKLVDVFPDGEARLMTDGILRLRYRDSIEKAARIEPGRIYRVNIDLGVTSNLFRAGHRIRLEVSSSNFPRFDRNANTGEPVGSDEMLRPAQQRVYHSGQYPSALLLPVVPPTRQNARAKRLL